MYWHLPVTDNEWAVVFAPAARRQLAALSPDVQRRITRVIDALAAEPRPHGAMVLAGDRSIWRVRVGDYRVLYEIRGEELVVMVVGIGHHREVYRGL